MTPGDQQRPIRQDAARNRERLLVAARTVFAERGHDVALDEVARAAGVSRTTLYRHFTTREQLAAVIFEENVALIEKSAEELAAADAGIVALFDMVIDTQVTNRSFASVLVEADIEWFTDLSRRTVKAFNKLLVRGRKAGIVQPGVVVDDIMLAISMMSAVIADSHGDVDADVRRARAILHRGLFTLAEPARGPKVGGRRRASVRAHG